MHGEKGIKSQLQDLRGAKSKTRVSPAGVEVASRAVCNGGRQARNHSVVAGFKITADLIYNTVLLLKQTLSKHHLCVTDLKLCALKHEYVG